MAKAKTKATEQDTQVLLAPVITEKSSMVGESGQIVFKIAPKATKKDVIRAVENLYNVTVEKVNTVNTIGKVKRFRGIIGKRANTRKAYVRLKNGDNIDLGTGI